MEDLIRRQDAIIAVIASDDNREALRNIKGISAVDPVVRGEWIKHEHGFWRAESDEGCTRWYHVQYRPKDIVRPSDLLKADVTIHWKPDYECGICGARGYSYTMRHCPSCGALLNDHPTCADNG